MQSFPRVPARLLALATLAYAFAAQATLPVQQWQTPSGARVSFVETHDLPMLDVAVDFPAGTSRDTREKSGLAALTLRMLRLGAQGLDEDQIAERLADVGADISGRFDMDRAGYGLRTLSSTRERDQAVAVLLRILQEPTFPQPIFEREKERMLAALKESDTKPETIADREFKRRLYADHPYSLRGSGEIDTVARLSRDDLVDFYRRHFSAGEAVVSIIGDLSREQARTLAEQLTSGLKAAAPLPAPPPVPRLAREQTSRIAHPATQAHILIGQPGIKRLDPDYFPLWVGNYVLGGGGFSSRLNEEIRQKRGFAYSAYSYFNPLAQQGPFQIGLQTKKVQAEEALKVARDTLAKFVADGPTQQEFEAAKQNIVGGFPLRIDSNRKILEYLSLIGFYRLSANYMEDFPARVDAVTLAEVKDAWRRRIDPARMVTVVVGASASP
jgi:zinc protease